MKVNHTFKDTAQFEKTSSGFKAACEYKDKHISCVSSVPNSVLRRQNQQSEQNVQYVYIVNKYMKEIKHVYKDN